MRHKSQEVKRGKVGLQSLAYYLCMDTVPKKVRCIEVIERERGEWWSYTPSPRWMGGRFLFSQGQGAHLFISLEVTMKFYRVLCSDDERDQWP